jgi:tetratricopeptide (TPR) repeat protein
MIQRLMKYNPAFLTPEELFRSFVVRLADLELILETIRHNTGPANQHILIIGPRGSGKTSLVLRTVAEVGRDAKLASKWYPIVFGEDSYEVCSAGEFWLEALFHLGKVKRLQDTNLSRWQRTYEELRSERDEFRLQERALAQLMDFADEQGKRLLLVVENLNMILGQQMDRDAAWDLRHTFLNEPRLMLLGTATSRFEEIENAGMAMYDLFRLHDLKPLNTEDFRTMWTAITGDELSENRVRPIEILTGGNPRLLAIIANFAAKTSFRELMQDLTHLVDDHTEYFKSHLDGLPSQERKVFVALADLWDPLTAREVANAARVDVNTASAQLNRLITRGAVVVFEKKGRKKWYQVAERMYNIYHLMRRRGAPSGRIWAVVNFMIHFYERDQLVDILGSITAEVCKPECDYRADHLLACELLLQKIPSTEKERILQAIPPLFFEMPDIPSTIKELFHFMKPAPEVKELAEAQERALEIPVSRESSEVDRLILLGDELRRNPDQVQEAEKAYRDAIAIDNKSAKAWASLANLLHNETGRFEEAEAAYRQAIELKPHVAWGWAHLGQFLHEKLERYEEAEAAYRKAVELAQDYAWAWAQLGLLLHEKLGRFDEAEAAYRQAIDLEPNVTGGWIKLGQLLTDKLGRFDEAEAAYRKAIELKPDSSWAWAHLGFLHEKLERCDEAEAAYRKASDLEPDYAWAWRHLGFLYEKLGRYDEAEKAYHKAVELQPDYALAWAHLGFVYEKLGRYDEAEKAYHKSVELQPDYAWAWAQLGLLLHEKLERCDEAEATYRQAIDLEPDVAWGWIKLGQLLHEKLGRFDEAEAAYRRAIELKPDYMAWAWAQLGQLLDEKLGRFDEAQKAYLTAIELDEEYYTVWEYLIKLQMQKLGDADAALNTLQTYLQSAQYSASSLINVACTILEQHWEDLYPQAAIWLQEAINKAPVDRPLYFALAYLQGRMGNWDNALHNASQYLMYTEIRPDHTGRVTNFFIEAAASGYPGEALQVLQKTPWASYLEPLVTGFKIYLGQEPTIALEILEVGRDVAQRIEDRKQQISRDSQKAKVYGENLRGL